MTAVTFRDVRAGWGRRTILPSADIDVPEGVLTALVGPNGSGKSTLLGLLAGSSARWSGEIRIGDTPLRTLRPAERASRVGALLQESAPLPELTAAEVVGLGLPGAGAPWLPARRRRDQGERVEAALARTETTALANRDVRTLSGGERQRVLLARALVGDPEVLVLDEPTNHLDPRRQIEIVAAVARLGITAFAALHTLELAARYADHVVVLDEGAVVAAGPPQVALSPTVLEQVFGVIGHYEPTRNDVALLRVDGVSPQRPPQSPEREMKS